MNSFPNISTDRTNLPEDAAMLAKYRYARGKPPTAAVKKNRPALRTAEFVAWLLSAAPSAKAIRFAFLDYFTGRFGRISPARQAALKASEAAATGK